MTRKYLILLVIVSLLSCSVMAQQVSPRQTPLPCTPSKDASQPWVHNTEVLSSFPSDIPLPRFLGDFRDKNWDYELMLYQDAKGIFGQLANPVLEADSPRSRLYDVVFEARNGILQFGARFRDRQLQFSGLLTKRSIKGTVTQNGRTESVILRKLRKKDPYPYTSRAQFDCAMVLYGRY